MTETLDALVARLHLECGRGKFSEFAPGDILTLLDALDAEKARAKTARLLLNEAMGALDSVLARGKESPQWADEYRRWRGRAVEALSTERTPKEEG